VPLWIALSVASGMALFLLKSRLNYLRLPELPTLKAPVSANVTVIIPARNEEHNIERAVRSFPGVQVIVVDDHSEDRTADLARAAGAEVIPAPCLDPHEMGKPNACAEGARHAQGEWLLFVDADTWFEVDFLASAVAYARAESLDLLTCFLRIVQVTWAERVLLPYSFALYFCGVSASNVNSPRSNESLANGQCMLFRRAAYEFVGGHGAVRSSVIEDVALAALAKKHRVPMRVVRAEKLGSVRMYRDLGSIWQGFAKNSFRFLGKNPWTGLQVIAASILLTSYVPIIGWLVSGDDWPWAIPFALVPTALLSGWYGGIVPALAAPAAIYIFQLIALDGMFRSLFRRKAMWKGRRV
jgi:chlorobactene glucosyltransferase